MALANLNYIYSFLKTCIGYIQFLSFDKPFLQFLTQFVDMFFVKKIKQDCSKQDEESSGSEEEEEKSDSEEEEEKSEEESSDDADEDFSSKSTIPLKIKDQKNPSEKDKDSGNKDNDKNGNTAKKRKFDDSLGQEGGDSTENVSSDK